METARLSCQRPRQPEESRLPGPVRRVAGYQGMGTVLVLNAGSSSLKFATYALGAGGALAAGLRGQLEGIGTRPRLRAGDGEGRSVVDETFAPTEVSTHREALGRLESVLERQPGTSELRAVGHRVVHGGMHHTAPARVTEALLAELESLIPLAPLHQPASLEGIRALSTLQPELPQVACFDTAFHQGMPELAKRFALPEALYQQGIRRYGFHGLSYAFISQHLAETQPALAQGRVVVAHLGNGASLCALQGGVSVDTTMSFSVLDGLPMGTRCGAVDPGVLLYLLETKRLSVRELEALLYHQAGLQGLSGESSDMRDLLSSASPGARLAVEYFGYRVARELGALAAVLGGLEGLVFTAGIGENAAGVRARVVERSAWLGLALDAEANARNAECISSAASRVEVRVIPTDEELTIARQTVATLELD
jgi:acetate kinase